MSLLSAALAAITVLGTASLLWGGLAHEEHWRIHLAALTLALGVGAIVLNHLTQRGVWYRVATGALALVMFLGLGIGVGGYDHLLRVVLNAHGLGIMTPPGDLWYEALGIALLPLGLWGLTTLKELSTKRDEE